MKMSFPNRHYLEMTVKNNDDDRSLGAATKRTHFFGSLARLVLSHHDEHRASTGFNANAEDLGIWRVKVSLLWHPKQRPGWAPDAGKLASKRSKDQRSAPHMVVLILYFMSISVENAKRYVAHSMGLVNVTTCLRSGHAYILPLSTFHVTGLLLQ